MVFRFGQRYYDFSPRIEAIIKCVGRRNFTIFQAHFHHNDGLLCMAFYRTAEEAWAAGAVTVNKFTHAFEVVGTVPVHKPADAFSELEGDFSGAVNDVVESIK